MSLQDACQKTRRDGADVTWRGSFFQATRNARLPTVDNRVYDEISAAYSQKFATGGTYRM